MRQYLSELINWNVLLAMQCATEELLGHQQSSDCKLFQQLIVCEAIEDVLVAAL